VTDLSSVRVVQFDWIDSTNDEAMRRIADGQRLPIWIVANQQSAGKGRSGRSWSSPAGNFAASLVVPVSAPAAALPQLSFVAGLAIFDAVSKIAGSVRGQSLRLKWPNDLLLDGAKVAGVLVETTNCDGQCVAILGFGVNLATAPEIANRSTSCLAAHGISCEPEDLRSGLTAAIDRRLQEWACGQGFATTCANWSARGPSRGQRISVTVSGERLFGRFSGLGPDGALLLEVADGNVTRLTHGDVDL